MFCKGPVPVFHTKNLHKIFSSPLQLCPKGCLLETELIVLEGTELSFLAEHEHVWEVTIPSYPSQNLLFVPKVNQFTEDRIPQPKVPVKPEILARLEAMVGKKYIWGGNVSRGIPEMLDWFPPSKELSEEEQKVWTFEGVDCSGMLYEATHGNTPRNTSQLVHFGTEIDVKEPLEPLDLIVWDGHVVIVLGDYTIEARMQEGSVFTTPTQERLDAAKEEAPHLTIRRWI